jgi:Protein of unknown function (DUF3277)
MVYSFLNVVATIAGPGGILNLAAGAAVAEEGITIEPTEDKNVMTIGADGKGQHSLVASDAATVTVRLLKTSPLNAALMIMYDVQSASSAAWGQNVFTIVDSARLDATVLQSAAFKKKPTITYAKEGGMMEWTFDAITANSILGANQ